MPIAAYPQPPRVLQVHRELLRPGGEAAYEEIEEDTARICRRLGCPHPYLGAEALTRPREAWFFNGYGSLAESERVAEAYRENGPLLAALQENSKRKAPLTSNATGVFAQYRQDLSRGVPWTLGVGRFLTITVTRTDRQIDGTTFETTDGTRFIVAPAQTRDHAAAAAAIAGPESKALVVRPSWSFPANEWAALDSVFWLPNVPL